MLKSSVIYLQCQKLGPSDNTNFMKTAASRIQSVPLSKNLGKVFSPLLPNEVRVSRKLFWRKELLQSIKYPCAFILNFLAAETLRNNFLLLIRCSIQIIFLQQAKWTKTVGIYILYLISWEYLYCSQVSISFQDKSQQTMTQKLKCPGACH